PIKKTTRLITIGVLTVVVGVSFFLILTARGDEPRPRADSIPNCEIGTLMTVGNWQAPVPGTPEWERLTFRSAGGAAEAFVARYMAAGRRDGRPTEVSGVRTIDRGRYYLPLSDAQHQGEVAFGVENVRGRYIVLSVEFCDGAEPAVDMFPG